MNSLVEQSQFGTVRITIGCMDKQSQVTYYNEAGEKQDIRGSSSEICDHINSLHYKYEAPEWVNWPV
jgi:hypothetical protein